ncbi:conjugal transfer protein TrbI, partial [Mesorhizobium sp. M4B.F.Ca.ET.089.01.1.1]
MKQSPELEAMLAGDDTAIANKNAKRNQLLGGAALLIGGVVAAYFVLSPAKEASHDITQGDEEFRTTTFRPPSFVREQNKPESQPDPAIINIPPPPEPVEPRVDTTEFNVPPPPPPVADRAAAPPPADEPPPEEFPQRYKSGLISLDQAKAVDGAGGLGGANGSGPTVAGE